MEDKNRDEREDVQKKTFTKWVNSQLSKGGHPPVTDLFYDLRDGTSLMALLEVLTGHKIKKEKGRMRVHHINNIDRALKFLEEQNVKLINIANESIADGSAKITLGLVWAIILHWQVQGVLREVMAELQQTNLEKTLLAWCRQTTQGYQGVDIRNFTTCWRDGLAFCAILHHHRPDLFEWPVMAKKHPYARLDNAFRIAFDHLNIERLLDPEDVNTQNPDKKSVMMYVMCLFQVLPHSSFSVDSLDFSIQSDSSFSTEANDNVPGLSPPAASSCLLTYQQSLEEVLTWLLGAEDKLAGMPSIADNTKDVKEQFHELEDLMLDLTSKQGGIGDVLGEGSRLLRENALAAEEAEEVKLQMKLLNTRWEDLRVRAMDRQTKLHEKLMKLQQDELEILKQWLTKTEDRIANMSQLGPTYQDLEAQLSSHQDLQKDLEAEQENINSLSNMVVVVDENCSDTASSSLEDELNALGERWAHICKWGEQRWVSLQTLQRHWGELDKEMVKFGEWLDDKERILKEMESNPTSDHQEMLKQASALRMLQAEMDVHLDRFNILQDKANIVLANLPKESTANEVVPLELESMQDRWDILVSIVDAHSQRITASGIDIRAIKVVSKVDSEVIKDEQGTTVTKITTTARTISNDKMEGGSPKRQKLSSKVHEDFSVAFQVFSCWMEGIEAQIQPADTVKLPTKQLQQLCQNIEEELKNNKEEYNKVLNLGHSATSDTSPLGESTTVENEVKLTSIKTRWTSMQKTLNNLRMRIKFNQEIEKNQPELLKIKGSCKDLEAWINDIQSTINIDSSLASQQLPECQEKKIEIRAKEEELIEMEKTAHNLSSLFSEEKEEFLRNVQAAIFETKNINMRICNWELILKDSARTPTKIFPETGLSFFASEPMDIELSHETKSKNADALAEFEDLSTWISQTEESLSHAHVSQILHKLQNSLRTFKGMMEEVDLKHDKHTRINDSLKKGSFEMADKVKELNQKWNQVIENIANRIAEIERGIERLHQFDEETSGMRSWLEEVETFLEAEDAAIGDVETLQAQLEQSNALQDDIITLQDNMTSITESGRYFQETGDEELRNNVTSLLQDIISRWEKAISKAKKQNLELKEALKNSQKVWDDCKDLNCWIDDTNEVIPKTFSIETTAELNSICELFDDIKQQVERKMPEYNSLRDFGAEISQFGSEKVQPSSELKEAIELLNKNWMQLIAEVDLKGNLVTNAREDYVKFKKLSSGEGKWHDDLETKIERSSIESTDAEEISEALDNLDSFLHSHCSDNLDEIKKLADDLIKAGLMTVAVQNITHNLTTRFETLTTKAQDQQLRLEGGVLEAQDLERDYVRVLDRISSGQLLLYQFPDQEQLAQLEADHLSHREVLLTMEQRVEEYKNQGKLHASQRLQDQLTHLTKQYDEFDEKFRLCQQAVDFDTRLLTLSQLLADTDQESRNFNIESVDQDHLEKQLSKCMVLYRSLSDVKSDVESLIATGRKLVKENMCSDPDTLTLQLDQLKALYNQLGGCVTEQRGRLESAIKHSKKLEKDSAQLEEWLSHIERELDLRETTVSVQNIHHEIEFAQNALDDVTRKKPVMSGLQESLASLTSLCGERLTKPLSIQISDLTLTWERVQKRLSNRVENLRIKDDSKEEEMEKFILKVGEIKAWLEKTEELVNSAGSLPSDEREKTLQNISNEVTKMKEEISGTRKLSEDLIAKGTLYESRLQPELVSLNRRWENISSAIKVQTQDRFTNPEQLHGRNLSDSTERTNYSSVMFSPTETKNNVQALDITSSRAYKSYEELCSKPSYFRSLSLDQNIQKDCNSKHSLKETPNLNEDGSDGTVVETYDSKSNDTLSLIEEDKVEPTKIAFEIPASSRSSESTSSVILNKDFRQKSPINYVESETEPENLDDVIASLQKVAEKDDSALLEKARWKKLQRDEAKEVKASIFKHSKRDDDDLESLASVDTDFAPLSEASRDLECTYSDLESISESVSSRGDPLLVSKEHSNYNSSFTSYNISSSSFDPNRSFANERDIKVPSTDSFPIFPKTSIRSEIFTTISNKDSWRDQYVIHNTLSNVSSQIAFSNNSSSLPVEKLQAMIAELDDVLESDSDSSDDERLTETTENDNGNLKLSKPAETSEKVYSQKVLPKYSSYTNGKNAAHNKSEPSSNPIEFKIQEVHVPGYYEFARAKPTVQDAPVKITEPHLLAGVSLPTIEEDSIQTSQNIILLKGVETCEARRVSIQSSSITEVVRGVTVEVSRDNLLAKPETASFITLTSCPGSEESLATVNKDKKQTDSLPYAIISSPPIIEYPTSVSVKSNSEITGESIIGNKWERDGGAKSSTDPKLDVVEAYFKEVSLIVDKIDTLRKQEFKLNQNQHLVALMDFEEAVCRLEPDVATLISRGDTLTLKTHIVDVPKANSVRIAVNDLRRCWTDLKDIAETLKTENEKVQNESVEAPNKAKQLIVWLEDVSKRISSANNHDGQLKTLEQEVSEKKSEVERLNTVGELLKKFNYHQLETHLTTINCHWNEIITNLSHFQKDESSYKPVGSSTSHVEDDFAIVPDFLANVNRLRESISSISRKLNSKTLTGRDYDNLVGKDEELKDIKKEVDRLKPKVDNVETERLSTIKKANQSQMEQVRRVIDKLREEWAQINRSYTEKHAWWLHNSETWRTLHRTVEDFSLWLNSAEEKLNLTTNQSIPKAKATQKELEKQVTLKHRPSQTLQTLCKEVTEELNSEDRHRLQDRVDSLLKRWRSLLLDLAARRERIAQGEASKVGTNSEFESVVTWVDSAHDLMDTPVNVTDEAALSAHTTIVKNHLAEIENHANKLKNLKSANFSDSESTQFSTIEGCFNRVRETFPDYKNKLEMKLKVIKSLVVEVDDLYKWTEEMRVRIALRNMSTEELRASKKTLKEKNVIYENLDNTYWALAQDAENKKLTVTEDLKSRMNSIETRLKNLESQFSAEDLMATLGAKIGVEKSITATTAFTVAPVTKVETAIQTANVEPVSGTTVSTSVSSVIQNVVKFEETVYSQETAVTAPFPKSVDGSSPTLILAALDKSILQIRDWLTLMEQMSRQQVAIMGDETDIRRLIEKQKSVLRELEGKKPQLDDLVASADGLKDDGSRGQIQQQVTKLREHWDETNSAVLARKTQLDAMLNDTHKFESKRIELETWLSRMEAKLDRMAPVSRIIDQLEQQIREQKSFHAEVNQYKYQFDLFTQMTSRLITVYQNDDTRRLKKASDSLNLRFSNLNSNIMTRGKNLYSSMNSAHSMSKALEKFISWLSESESNVGVIEMEVDKMPPSTGTGRRDASNPRSPFTRLKDLQSEIESHKDVLASLNATGQKLLGTLENQDDAVLLHRRLDEMNHRWNTLKYKSIAIRNRLEGTAENWNSLLLSLRELIEWVIRKDTELTGMGPLIGDVNILSKYEDELSTFRRFLDEKQPVIDSNLKSGRQLIASEPPLSDTSDSEAGRDVEGDARYRGEENTRELVRSVRREVAKLSEKWATLWDRAANIAAQVSLAHKKLGVLQKTLEDVSSRLEESEKVVATWGPIPHDSNLADQHVHNVRKFRENASDLQRGVDDVNDQAARFSAHNIPLTPQNSAALHDLNNRWKNLETTVNDRWRQVAGRSREVTPLTPAQLASSVNPPWERATATNKVPYYINHSQETTHWDHPIMMDLLDSLADYNHIKFSAYRTASKLRSLQKKLSLDRAKLQLVTDVFDEHGLRGQNDRLIDVNDMIVVLSTLYGRISADHIDVNTTIATDLCLNWLLNVYDSQRTGQMRVLSFRVGLICLCRGHLEEKYRYMFRLIADPNRLVDQRKLGLLLHDCVQVPRQLGEVAAFGGSNIEPSVRSCFTKAGKDRENIEAVHFLTWVQQEPQSLVWLAVLHRVAASESVQHQVKCNICKTYPITGLRYRCLKCLSFDMCQRCFFDGRSSKSHKITHPMHEYCTATTAGDEMKDFTKALKNKFKSKRSLQKHTKKGYLPVQTVLEGDPLESPSPSPSHNVSSQDMHSRLELYASRLAEVELRTNSNSTPDSEDEHGLIAQYCQSLSSSDAPFPVPKSPLQIMASVDADQKDELEQMIRDLEEENQALQAEYERLKSQQPTGSALDDGMGQRSEAEMLAEAKLLREHKGRLEARMSILEDHNRQLEAQLQRLRQLLVEQQGGMGSPNKSGTLQTKSVTASQLAMDSPAKINGHSSHGGMGSSYDGLDQLSDYVRPPPPPVGNIAHMGNLYSRAAPYRGPSWRPGEGGWQSSGLNEPREGERLA